MSMVSTRVKAIPPSLHEHQTGTVVADYDSMLIIKCDDEAYQHAWKRTDAVGNLLDGKYLQLDASYCIEIAKE